ncbi:hypothetical protein Lal_00024516 [Lupinus albus]|nr:hypothetical protein Lal_00024516 [Lupinus albus]
MAKTICVIHETSGYPLKWVGPCTTRLWRRESRSVSLFGSGLYTNVSLIAAFALQTCSSLSMMWSFASNALSSIRKRSSGDLSQTCAEGSDDDVCSNASRDEVLECPICWESFNIVENVPYVLWCGHTLCKNCVLGLQWSVLKFPTQQVKVPFFISCPWCHLLSLRLVYKGNLKYPCKNFFLLWMVESRNGDRQKVVSTCVDSQQIWSSKSNLLGNQATNCNLRRASTSHSGSWGSNSDVGGSDEADKRNNFLRCSLTSTAPTSANSVYADGLFVLNLGAGMQEYTL